MRLKISSRTASGHLSTLLVVSVLLFTNENCENDERLALQLETRVLCSRRTFCIGWRHFEEEDPMPYYTAIVTVLVVLFYFFVATRVSAARQKFGVKLPATSGHPDFD